MQQTETDKKTIVFIHGAWHGAWCWDDWQQFFNKKGFNAIAVDLRGHGSKGGSYKHARMRDYVSDVERFIDQLDSPPILVGHSMGCKVVQHIIAKNKYPNAVLVAPIPAANAFKRALLKQMIVNPKIFTKSLLTRNMKPWVSDKKSANLFFSYKLDGALANKYLQKMQGESFSLFLIDLLFKSAKRNVGTPVLVLAAEHDAFFSVPQQRRTARKIEAEFMIAYDAGHDVMLDVTAEESASSIHSWLISQR